MTSYHSAWHRAIFSIIPLSIINFACSQPVFVFNINDQESHLVSIVNIKLTFHKQINKQEECIPVGCILPTCWPYLPAWTARGGVCLSACLDTPPWVWAWRPPECGPGDTPRCGPRDTPWPDPSTSPGCGPGDTHPWRPARHAGIPPLLRRPARHAGIPPARHAGIPPRQ